MCVRIKFSSLARFAFNSLLNQIDDVDCTLRSLYWKILNCILYTLHKLLLNKKNRWKGVFNRDFQIFFYTNFEIEHLSLISMCQKWLKYELILAQAVQAKFSFKLRSMWKKRFQGENGCSFFYWVWNADTISM